MPSILDQIEQTLSPKKVGIIEFCESSDYCNKQLFPRQEVLLKLFFLEELTGPEEDVLTHWIQGGNNGTEFTISPNIRERVEWLRENEYSHFREITLVGGRRSSKGYITGLAMAYTMWNCLQLQDPGAHYGIDPEKEIYFSCVAGSEQQAKEYQYADFSSTIETCKAFEPYLVKSLETEIRVATEADLRKTNQMKALGNKIQKDIARLRGKALAANAGTLRGSATMAIAIDEMAHMIPGESKAAADKVYDAAKPSLNQFGRDGLMFLNSSPYTKVGMFYERYEAALLAFNPKHSVEEEELQYAEQEVDNKNGNPRVITFQFPSWGLFEDYQRSKHKLLGVITANPAWDPKEERDGKLWWNNKDRNAIREARAEEADNPETFKVERRGKFAEVVDAFLIPTMVDKMYQGKPEEWIAEVNRSSGNTVYRLKKEPYPTNWGQGALNIHRYKFHVDPSSTTAGFGFAIAHLEHFNRWDGYIEEHVVFDVIKRWLPKEFGGEVIKWEPILVELQQFADIFRPFEITMDQHQSAEPMQDLQERLTAHNIDTRVYEKYATNELNWKRWEVFKTALYQGRVHAPSDTEDAKYSAQELKFLQENRTGGKYPRIDRQEIGPVQTKDMADCISECVYSLIGNMNVNRTQEILANSSMVGGAPGGYGIGYSGLPFQQGGNPRGYEGQFEYSNREKKEAKAHQNPARGVLGRGRGRSGNSNRSRW